MNQERLLQVILTPHVSEKATIVAEKYNEFIFRVVPTATKPEVKDAIEFIFNAKVKDVRIVNVRSKRKTFKSIEGKTKGWKKAYVTLQADQKLDMMGAQ
ncbi:MAG: 50S ribosomal protein L23 [Gammaproteobacteria bacterium RIFCSPHIGHO2_12_FULL_45_12]|nr:MAG: 50S ribosomal protein L23 [Gammaproteobacteria bacterium RIFCSPHIGHO2_12_FULL_45_12]